MAITGGPGFKSRSDHLDLFHGSPVFKSKANWFAFRKLGFLTNFMSSLYIYFNDL